MTRRTVLPILLIACALAPTRQVGAQTDHAFESVHALRKAISAAAADPRAEQRQHATGQIWQTVVDAGDIPFVRGDSALFLWRGASDRVSVAGDFNGWRPDADSLARIGESDIWMRAISLPRGARIEYKFVVGARDARWLVDPANPRVAFGGAGENSELRMPDWRENPLAVPNPDIQVGLFNDAVESYSVLFDDPVTFWLYTPAAAAGKSKLPVIYATDGQEYADPRLGALPTIVDNLIEAGLIEPCLVVFVSPIRVDSASGREVNLRRTQYVGDSAFASFVATELVPLVDAIYPTRPDRNARVILGTSLGGLFATMMGVEHGDVFGKLAIQSPAYWVTVADSPFGWSGAPMVERVADVAPGTLTIAMSSGTIRDSNADAVEVRDALIQAGQHVRYFESAEGHSWTNWRNCLPDLLTALLPASGHAVEK